MRIAILTLRLHKNYGGVLQNYALTKALESLGHEVETIDVFWDIRPKGVRKYFTYCKRFVKKYILGKHDIQIFKELQILEQDKLTTQNIKRFKSEHLNLSRKRYVLPGGDFSDINDRYDAVVVGSDQVWRPKYTKDIYKYYLDFINKENVKKLAYAASFGCDECEYSEIQNKKCGELIHKFNAVSVREKSAISLINDIFQWNIEVKQCIDPTMLLEKEDYEKIIFNKNPDESIFVYVLDINDDKSMAINRVSEAVHIPARTLLPKGLKNNDNTVIPPVDNWLESIHNSKLVITDSFHGCVFSIIFNKSFVVYGNPQRGKARFYSLLAMFHLEDRYIESASELTTELLNKPIDWDSVNRIREENKDFALDFLKKNLK